MTFAAARQLLILHELRHHFNANVTIAFRMSALAGVFEYKSFDENIIGAFVN
jgi:hypothetical protein